MAGGLTVVGLRAKMAALAKSPSPSPVRIGDGGGLHLLVKPGHPAAAPGCCATASAASAATWASAPTRRSGWPKRATPPKARRRLRAGADPLAWREAREAPSGPGRRPRPRPRRSPSATPPRPRWRPSAPGWSNAKHAAQWLATLEQHAFPKHRRAAGGRGRHGGRCCGCCARSGRESRRRPAGVRQRIEAVLDFARVRGWRDGRRTRRAGAGTSPKCCRRRGGCGAVAHRAGAALAGGARPSWPSCRGEGVGAARAALRHPHRRPHRRGARHDLGRGGPGGGALDRAGGRMKARRAHRVPLSAAALAVLAAVRPDKPRRDGLVFPGPAARCCPT